MKTHQVILRDSKGKFINEVRFCNGLLYRQNRNYDIEISLDAFIESLQAAKAEANRCEATITYTIIDKNTPWMTV